MNIRRITSLLVGIAFVGGSLSTYIYAPWKGDTNEVMLALMFVIGLVMVYKGVWAENYEAEDDEAEE